MYENSKILSARQNRFSDRGRPEQTICQTAPLVTHVRAPDRERAAGRIAMENFGRAIADLLDCESCYVATRFPNATSGLDEVRIGHTKVDPSCAAAVERIARQGKSVGCTFVDHIDARTNFVRKLIGAESDRKGHSVIGRMSIAEGATVVFVAGWRPAALLTAEIPCVARAIRAMWETTQAASACPPTLWSDCRTWLDDLIFPAIIVDEELFIHEVNESGRAFLAAGEFLKADRGTLSGLSLSVTDNLRKTISAALMSQSNQGCLNAAVPLSVDPQRFAFARVGLAPGDPEKVLVIVPRFDEASGARRIASAFGLTWAEERIVARILQGQCSRRIGDDLRLTEATVRTYTKRIMMKLGINRQSEFFLLHHLTSSPFGAAVRNKKGVHQTPPQQLSRRAH